MRATGKRGRSRGFERPGRPERHDRQPVLVRLHHPLAARGLALGHVEQQRAAMRRRPFALLMVLDRDLVGQKIGCPDLAMRMRVRTAHHRALVLEQLHRQIIATQHGGFGAPGVDHCLERRPIELRERRAMIGREADHPRTSADRLSREQGDRAHRCSGHRRPATRESRCRTRTRRHSRHWSRRWRAHCRGTDSSRHHKAPRAVTRALPTRPARAARSAAGRPGHGGR